MVGVPRGEGAPRRRPQLQKGIIILPSAFTMANLFFGVWAIVSAAEGQLIWAGWFIIFSGILDMLDGRIARFTRTGSGFGAELDSLVDAISFGVAPGLILYYQFYSVGTWSWLISLLEAALPRSPKTFSPFCRIYCCAKDAPSIAAFSYSWIISAAR